VAVKLAKVTEKRFMAAVVQFAVLRGWWVVMGTGQPV
jgi:hypothetical protein